MSQSLTDEEIYQEALIIKKSQKDPRFFSPIYKKYYPDIFRYIFKRTNDTESTADITSQVFLKALIHLYKWKNEGLPFSAWLYRIALNECREYFRRSNRIQYVIIDHVTKTELQEVFQLDETDLKYNRIKEALSRLKAKELQMVELRFFEKRSFKEIGYLLEITENNAKVRLYRIIDKIKKSINI